MRTMQKLVYPAVFKKNTDVGYTIVFPDLEGCITYGEDAAEALIMANDAACGWILDELEDGKLIPKASAPEEIILAEGEFLSLMPLDIESYALKYGNKTVKKNTTIPAFLNTFGESINANYSKLLTDKLMELYLAARLVN